MTYRIMTYNAHRCLGTDGRLAPQRIAAIIAACDPDIVALQELDVGRVRTGGVDQAELIARALDMQMHFHPAFRVFEELYGDAILTRAPSRLVKAGPLPSPLSFPPSEPRGALWVSVEIEGGPVEIVNTHLGLSRPERWAQVECLLGPDWLGSGALDRPLVLTGDFNAVQRGRTYRRLAGVLNSARAGRDGRGLATFPSRLPVLALDHIFVSPFVEVLTLRTLRTPLARVASDHLPLTADLRIAEPGA